MKRTPTTNNITSGMLRATLFSALSVLALSSCDKLDDYSGYIPGGGDVAKAHLYVSNAAATNTLTLYNVTGNSNMDSPKTIQTDAKDGNGVAVSPMSNTLYQVGRTEKVIKVFKDASSLSPAPSPFTMFTDPAMTSGREIAFDERNQLLYVANNVDSTLLVYSNPMSLSGTVTATKTLKLKGQPWGIHYDKENDRLFVLLDLDATTIEIYSKPVNLQSGKISADCSFKVAGATRLHGLTYSSKADVLIVTEIAEAMGGSAASDGGIYIFENAKNTLKGKGVVLKPTRTIKGSNTMLGNPVDVAFDDRTYKNEIYVAEKANKRILVFGLKNSGNIAPKSAEATTESPEAIYLDIR